MNACVIPIVPAVSIKRILYATDFSEASLAALPIAANLARHYGSHLYVTHIWSALPVSMTSSVAAISMYDQLQKAAVTDIGKVLESKELKGLPTTSIVEEGSPPEEICRILEEQKIDLVVIGTHGRTGINHLLMGSMAEQICRSAICPVLTVGPNVEKRFSTAQEVRSILFPTDMSYESVAVMPYVALISAEFNSVVNMLHVLPASTGTNPDARTLAEPLRNTMKQICQHYLSPRCDADCAIEFGDTAEVILKAADQTKADLIAMGVRNAFALGLHLQNTVAYKVIIGATCPVLTYRTKNHHPFQKTRVHDEAVEQAAMKKRKAEMAKRIEQSAKHIKDSKAMIDYTREVILDAGRKATRQGQLEKIRKPIEPVE